MALINFDAAQARINLHPDKSHRLVSSSKLANGRLHAHHSAIAMSLIHPAVLMFTLFVVLRMRSMSLKFDLRYKRYYRSHGNKGRPTRQRLTLETTVLKCVYVDKGEMYLLVIIHQRLIMSGDVELNPGPLDGEFITIDVY